MNTNHQSYLEGLAQVLKPHLEGQKSAMRLAFERALSATHGSRSAVAGKVFRALHGYAGISRR